MKHLMIDLETLGTSPDSVFLSVAAIQFDIATGKIGNTFLQNVDLGSALKMGRTISPDTIKWWLEQRQNILLKMFKSPVDLTVTLAALSKFCGLNGIVYPWGNSASFDLGMLNHAFKQCGIAQPWQFYNERCYRTAVQLLPEDMKAIKDANLAHDPVYDCKYQIANLVKLNKMLNFKF